MAYASPSIGAGHSMLCPYKSKGKAGGRGCVEGVRGGEGSFDCATGRPAGAGRKARPSGRFAQDDGEKQRRRAGLKAAATKAKARRRRDGESKRGPSTARPARLRRERLKRRDAPLRMTAKARGDRQASAPGTACCAPTKAKSKRRQRRRSRPEGRRYKGKGEEAAGRRRYKGKGEEPAGRRKQEEPQTQRRRDGD